MGRKSRRTSKTKIIVRVVSAQPAHAEEATATSTAGTSGNSGVTNSTGARDSAITRATNSIGPTFNRWITFASEFRLHIFGFICFTMFLYHLPTINMLVIANQQQTIDEQSSTIDNQKLSIDNQKLSIDKHLGTIYKLEAQLEELWIIYNQLRLINAILKIMYKACTSIDEHIEYIDDYYEMQKKIDDSWLNPLTHREQKYMNELRDYLGVSGTLDANAVKADVRDISKQTSTILDKHLSELEEALNEMDLDTMKQLQMYFKNEQLYSFLRTQMERMLSQIRRRASRGLQARNLFSAVFDTIMEIISKTAVPVTKKLITHFIL